jgi:hypothetical protein
VVNGSPVEVLRILLDPDSSTSILGPASEVEVLQSEHGQQVVRIRVEASGHVGQVSLSMVGTARPLLVT